MTFAECEAHTCLIGGRRLNRERRIAVDVMRRMRNPARHVHFLRVTVNLKGRRPDSIPAQRGALAFMPLMRVQRLEPRERAAVARSDDLQVVGEGSAGARSLGAVRN